MSDLHPNLSFNEPDPNYDYHDNRTWISRELVLERELDAATADRDFLREVLRGILEEKK